jgi:DNA polymerase III delta subunit
MLTTRGEEFKVMGMLAWHLRKMLAAARQARSGGSPEQALGRMPYRQKQAAMALLRRRGVDALRRDFRALLETDLAMKSGTPATAALQTLLVRLCN